MKETEVNAFTGHSNNSHTSLNYYCHLDRNWAGNTLVSMSSGKKQRKVVEQEVQDYIDADEEGAEQEPEEEEDVQQEE